MKRDNYYNYIDEQLHILALRITTNGKLNMLRLHIHSENFYLHFFNLLYGYNLINLNDISQNVEAIDLIDHDKKIIIQVSSTSTKQKIESALSKDTLKEYAGYRFKFISIAKDATDLRDKTYKNPHSIIFDPKKDIYDIRFFLNNISSLDIDKMKDVYVFIEKELGEGSKNRFDSTILKEKYLTNFKTISLLANDKKPIDDIFVNLAIIKDNKKKLLTAEDFLEPFNILSNMPKENPLKARKQFMQRKNKNIIFIEILINISNKSLIYGKAGIGKTTLCKYIAYKWAKGELYQEFEYVIYISLREWKTKGLKGAIKDYYYSQDEEKITFDIKANNSKILFLFDGYDELNGDKKKDLTKEIEHYSLTHYIITTRPYGYQKSDFRVDEYFETIGFTDEDVEKYVDAFFKENQDKAKSLKVYLQNNINIKQIGYIPLILEMICSQWEQKEFSKSLSMTEIYTQVVEDMLNKYSAQKDDKRVYKRKNRKKIKEQLGKLSFMGLTKQTILFDGNFIEESIEDIDFFEGNTIYSGLLKLDDKEKDLLDNNFEFLHLTFQEYFSALYISTLSEEEQSKIIQNWKFYPHMQIFFTFLGGLIKNKEFLLQEIESEPMDISHVYMLNLFLMIQSELSKDDSKKVNGKINFYLENRNINEWARKKIFYILHPEEVTTLSMINENSLKKYYEENSIKKKAYSSYNQILFEKMIQNNLGDDFNKNSDEFVAYLINLLTKNNDIIDEEACYSLLSLGKTNNKIIDAIIELIKKRTPDLDNIERVLTSFIKFINEHFNVFNRVYEKTKGTELDYILVRLSIVTLFKAFEEDYKIFPYIYRHCQNNNKPLFINEKNQLSTIENGKDISTQREVDKETLNEVMQNIHK